MTGIISLQNVEVTIDNWPILQGVDWEVTENEHCLVVGPSGSGKSTLLGLVGGLIVPCKGHLTYRGASYPSPKRSAAFRRSTFGFLFQDFHLIEHMSVADNLGLMQAANAEKKGLPSIGELLEPLGLANRSQAPVQVLSRGERQRVALARAFANRPEVLLADEPTASLDPESASETLAHLWNMCDHLETTAIVVSHDQELTRDKRFTEVRRLVKGRLEKSE